MHRKQLVRVFCAGVFLWAGFISTRAAETGQIQVKLTKNGLESLTYQGVEYCDPSGCGVLGFSERLGHEGGNLWAPCVVDVKKSKEAFSLVSTNAELQGSTVTKTFPWGTLAATYTVNGADLYVTATITNTSTTPIGWWKANLLQLNSRLVFDKKSWDKAMPYGYTPEMHWDYRYAMWQENSDGYETWNFTDPHVYWWVDKAAPFDKTPVKVMFADLDPKWQTGVYHVKTDHGDAWPVVGSADGDPGNTPPVAPGKSDVVHVVIRFRNKAPDDIAVVEKVGLRVQALEKQVASMQEKLKAAQKEKETGLGDASVVTAAEKTLAAQLAELAKAKTEQQTNGVGAMPSALDVCVDGYEAFGRAYPRTVRWTDRRPIGTLFGCRGNNMGGTNTNGWFNDKTIDIDTPAGRKVFAEKLLAEIDRTIGVLKEVDAQGVIWWDIEGARNPHPITYIGDPRVLDPKHPQHDKYVPELDTEVEYKGQKMMLVDACFKKFQDAGLKTGVTIRPNTLVWNGKPEQTGGGDAAEILCAKVTYAREHWGCSLFYVDSVSEWFSNWSFEKTVAKYPDILLMPEWARTRSYRHSSQSSYTRFTGFWRGVPAEMQACWPDAFCCMTNVDYVKNYEDALYAVRHGNVQMFNCWYMCDEAKAIKKIHQETGVRHTPSAEDQKVDVAQDKPTPITLRATDEDKDPVTYVLMGPPEHGTLGGFDAKAGTVTYTPAKGYTGPDRFTFKALDPMLSSNRAMVTITVK
jgi:hypothetical protein